MGSTVWAPASGAAVGSGRAQRPLTAGAAPFGSSCAALSLPAAQPPPVTCRAVGPGGRKDGVLARLLAHHGRNFVGQHEGVVDAACGKQVKKGETVKRSRAAAVACLAPRRAGSRAAPCARACLVSRPRAGAPPGLTPGGSAPPGPSCRLACNSSSYKTVRLQAARGGMGQRGWGGATPPAATGTAPLRSARRGSWQAAPCATLAARCAASPCPWFHVCAMPWNRQLVRSVSAQQRRQLALSSGVSLGSSQLLGSRPSINSVLASGM